MSKSLSDKVDHGAKSSFIAPVFPFLQKDWPQKMWLFLLLSYIPFLNVIVARGWRKEYVSRIGWSQEKVLPSPANVFRFLIDGFVLWMTTGVYLCIPIILIVVLGLGGWLDLWQDIKYVWNQLLEYFWFSNITWSEFSENLKNFTKSELMDTVWVFLIENIYLIIYLPIYRIGMIRYALTGELFKSHFSIGKNLKFLFKNLGDIVLMYLFGIYFVVLISILNIVFSFTGVGLLFIAIFSFFMPFWATGYEYGLLARQMVEQENMINKRNKQRYNTRTETMQEDQLYVE